MESLLESVLAILTAHRDDLRRMGVAHAAVFGSVARGDFGPESDVDILVELDPERPIGLFQYSRLSLYLASLVEGRLPGGVDVANRKTLKPLLREAILRDSVYAF